MPVKKREVGPGSHPDNVYYNGGVSVLLRNSTEYFKNR